MSSTAAAALPRTDGRPGLHPRRLARLIEETVARCSLDLRGAVVLTEAATGSYAVTPLLAASAGAAKVYAIARSTRHGSLEQAIAETGELARWLGIEDRIEIVTERRRDIVEQADIVTNSGHVRPIDETLIGWMKPTAVIPLMYEAWELRPADLDVDACRRKGILVAGTNERHPAVDVFSFLGVMAVRLLTDAGVSTYKSTVLVLCDNDFGPYITRTLEQVGATVDAVTNVLDGRPGAAYDAILVATTPRTQSALSAADAGHIARTWPGAVVAQFFGDIDRSYLSSAGLSVWPPREPGKGHMGILPAEIGPEPTLRLQSGGLKVGEVLWRYRENPPAAAREYIDRFITSS